MKRRDVGGCGSWVMGLLLFALLLRMLNMRVMMMVVMMKTWGRTDREGRQRNRCRGEQHRRTETFVFQMSDLSTFAGRGEVPTKMVYLLAVATTLLCNKPAHNSVASDCLLSQMCGLAENRLRAG